MRAQHGGDALCVGLAVLAVVDVVQLGLQPLIVVTVGQLLLWVLLLARQVSVWLVVGVPLVPPLLGVLAPGTNDATITQAAAGVLAAYWIGRLGTSRQRAVAVPRFITSSLAIELQGWPLDRTDISDVVYLTAPVLLALAVGTRLARRRDEQLELTALRQRLDAQLAEQAERLLRAERDRIGRELHDVVAHAAGAVVAQVTAARVLVEASRCDEAVLALAAVEDAARDGLADMRRLLGVLREPVHDDGALAVG